MDKEKLIKLAEDLYQSAFDARRLLPANDRLAR